jgi:large subunit ribosomal protein L30
MSDLLITWSKSTIGYPQAQRRVIKALGLRKLNHTVKHANTPTIRGMLHKVRHLIKVEGL